MFPSIEVDIIKLVLALVFGGVIGLERELRSKSAGFRTMILICVGSAFYTDIAVHIGTPAEESRIVANIITGIGFLGAGAIFRDTGNGTVSGMTTASMIWIVAAIGMAVGFGEYWIAVVVTLLTQIVLWGFTGLQRPIDAWHEARTYTLMFHRGSCSQDYLEKLFAEHGMKHYFLSFQSEKGIITIAWTLHGSSAKHRAMMERLLVEPAIDSVRI